MVVAHIVLCVNLYLGFKFLLSVSPHQHVGLTHLTTGKSNYNILQYLTPRKVRRLSGS